MIKENPEFFKFASDELKKDRNFVLDAAVIDGGCLEFADFDLSKELEFLREVMERNLEALEQWGNLIGKREERFQKIFEEGSEEEWQEISQEVSKEKNNPLKNNKSFILEAIEKYPKSLAFASDELKKDEEVVLAAVIKDRDAWKYADSSLHPKIAVAITSVENVMTTTQSRPSSAESLTLTRFFRQCCIPNLF